MEQAITETQSQEVAPAYDIDGFLEKRKEFIEKVNKIMVEGADYHTIQSRKSMAKGGAEKIASIFGWTATYEIDKDSTEALGNVPGVVCYVCKLCKENRQIGEGRGAATLQKNGSDPNKTLKMAQKSAFIDAVIRASGLSDFYTQDLGPDDEGSSYGHVKTERAPKVSTAQLNTIKSIAQEKNYTKEDVVAKCKEMGFDTLTGGKGGSASRIIDWLINASTKEIAPAIRDEEADREIQEIADRIDY